MAVSFQLDEEKTAYTGVNFDQEDYRYHYETITFRQRLANTASRLIYSRGYFAIYLICLILNVLLLAYGIKHISMFRKRGLIQVEAWYITIDILVSILLVLEISIRIIASPSVMKSWFPSLSR